MRNEVGQRNKAQQQTYAHAEGQAGDSADQRDNGGFDEELTFDVDGSCTECLADSDLASALRDGDQHDVHDPDAAEGEGKERDGSEEQGHHGEDSLGKLRPIEGVPYPQSFFVVWIVVVTFGDDPFDLGDCFFVQIGRDGFDDDVVDEAANDAGALGWGEVARHGGVVGKELRVVRAASVAAILFLLGENADDGVLIAVDYQGLSDDGLAGKELAVRFGAEEDHASALGFILLGHQASLFDGEGAKALVLRPDPADGAVRCIPLAHLGDGATQLRTYGFDQRGLLLDGDGVIDGEANIPAGSVSACLSACFSTEEDGNVSADAAEMLFLIYVEADAEADQQNDRGDTPHDAEHRQKAAKLRFPERGQRLLKNLVERHRRNGSRTRMELLPRLRKNHREGSFTECIQGDALR